MTAFVFILYRYLFFPLVFTLLQIARPFLSGKIRQLIDSKNKNTSEIVRPEIFSSRPVWIHAASGEIEYARPLIRELKQKSPQLKILVTYSSPSALGILTKLTDVDAWTILPWEFSSEYQKFLKKWNPQLLLIARTDVWPVMIDEAKKFGIPRFLFSATFAQNSSRLKGLSRYLTIHSLQRLNAIFCVSAEDRQQIEDLPLQTPNFILGDSRFDQVLYRLAHSKLDLDDYRSEKWTFIMGSTWAEDEKILIPALGKLKNPTTRFILAPHEVSPRHLDELVQGLDQQKLTHHFYSQGPNPDADVLIIDKIGVLAEFYKISQAAFVGGSFKKQVHSVMEPLGAGLPVCVGPFHQNNREALQYQSKALGEATMVTVVKSTEDVVTWVKLLQRGNLVSDRNKILEEVRKNSGATQRLLEALQDHTRIF